MAGAQYGLDNLWAIVDRNGLQISGTTEQVMGLEDFAAKWRAFGWRTVECDGHDMRSVLVALHTAAAMRHPTAILMRTVKGKGVSFMEDESAWHGRAPSEEELLQAVEEIMKGGEA